MKNLKVFIDFDGVIFDTEKRISERKKQSPEISWSEFLNQINWFKLLEESKAINNSIKYILESQDVSKQIAILTKVHTLLEMEAKIRALREKNIEVPVLCVPPQVKKSQVSMTQYTEDIFEFLEIFSQTTEDVANDIKYYQIPGLDEMNKVNMTCLP